MTIYSPEEINDIRASVNLTDVVSEYTSLARAGSEYKGCCPFHDDHTPSFYVNDENGKFNCFGCGAHGDVFQFVMDAEGVDFPTAVQRIAGGFTKEVTPRRISLPKSNNVELARRIWREAQTIVGTPAALYLESRSVGHVIDHCHDYLRFDRLSFDGSATLHPAMIAAIKDENGYIQGIQRTYLNEDGTKLHAKDSKRSLGDVGGNAIRLHQDVHFLSGEPTHIFVCEGLEDGLSLARMAPPGVDHFVWVTAGAGMMRNIKLPDTCTSITIGIDNDEAGQKAALALDKRLTAEGILVDVIAPNAHFKDFNEELNYWFAHSRDDAESPWGVGCYD